AGVAVVAIGVRHAAVHSLGVLAGAVLAVIVGADHAVVAFGIGGTARVLVHAHADRTDVIGAGVVVVAVGPALAARVRMGLAARAPRDGHRRHAFGETRENN